MDSLTATVDFVLFPRGPFEDSTFVIMAVREKGSHAKQTVKGEILWSDLSEYIERKREITFTGEWETHHKYGKQLKFTGYHEFTAISGDDINPSAMAKFITENCDGIGSVGATEMIINAGGVGKLVEMLEEGAQQQLLLLHARLDDRLAIHLSDRWIRQRNLMKTISFFADFEITGVFPRKIFEAFGEAAVEIVKEDPYILIDEVENIGFKRADEIALKMGIARTAPVRMKAAVIFTIQESCYKAGNCFMYEAILLQACKKLTKVPSYRIGEALEELLEDGEKVEKDGLRIYLPEFLHTEIEVGEYIKRMLVE